MLLAYIEETVAPASAQPQLVLVPATPVTVTEATAVPAKPRAARRRESSAKTST